MTCFFFISSTRRWPCSAAKRSRMPRVTAGRAFDLEEFAVPGEVAESYWAMWRWRSAPALGLVPIPLQLDELGQPDDQPGDFLRLIIGQPLVREGDSRRWLPVHMGQRQAIGIDHTIAARDRLESPWSREAALRHAARISCAAAGGPSGGQRTMELSRPIRVESDLSSELTSRPFPANQEMDPSLIAEKEPRRTEALRGFFFAHVDAPGSGTRALGRWLRRYSARASISASA